MPLKFKNAPQAVTKELSKAFELLGNRERLIQNDAGLPPRDEPQPELFGVFPHPVYVFGLDQVISRSNVAENASQVSWRYLIPTSSPVSAAEVSTSGEEPQFSELNWGLFAQNTLLQIQDLQDSPELADDDYEVRLLRIPALSISALWLCGTSGEQFFIPIAPTSAKLVSGYRYTEAELLARIHAEAAGLQQAVKYLKEDAEQPLRTQEEIENAIKELTSNDLLRLRQYARNRIMLLLGLEKARGNDGHDLLQEAIIATLNRHRTWRENIPFRQHLIGVMRSISSQWGREEAELHPVTEASGSEENSSSPEEVWVADTPDPQRALEAKERLEHLRDLFSKDPIALDVAYLRGQGYTAKQIQSELNMSEREFDATSKRVRRNLQSWSEEGRI